MDDLIYEFLLQSGYPRASILGDPALVIPVEMLPEFQPIQVIIDPETTERLAIIKVVEAVDADGLAMEASNVERIARYIGGISTQGFVIRFDPHGIDQAEQVQFFRVWPSNGITTLTARNFPDLDSLRVSYALTDKAKSVSRELDDSEADEPDKGSALPGYSGFWLPALLLLALALVDGLCAHFLDISFLTVPISILAVGAALISVLACLVYRLEY